MAYNPRPSLDDTNEYDITKIHEFPPPLPKTPDAVVKTACGIKREYYMEWWEIGNDHSEIEMGHFHSGNLKHFLTVFLGAKKYTVIYLERVEDCKVIRDARNTCRR